MFSPDKFQRKASLEKLKYCSGAQLVLGVGLFVCAIIASVKHDSDEYQMPYFVGGYTCGILGALAGALGVYSTYKVASTDSNDLDVLRKLVMCPVIAQMVIGFLLFLLSLSGIMMNIIYLVFMDTEETIHLILAVCILVGICILLVVTFIITKQSCCHYGGEYNQRTIQTYPRTVGGNQFLQRQTAFGQQNTGGFLTTSNLNSLSATQSNFGMAHQQPSAFGFQQNNPTAPPPSYPY